MSELHLNLNGNAHKIFRYGLGDYLILCFPSTSEELKRVKLSIDAQLDREIELKDLNAVIDVVDNPPAPSTGIHRDDSGLVSIEDKGRNVETLALSRIVAKKCGKVFSFMPVVLRKFPIGRVLSVSTENQMTTHNISFLRRVTGLFVPRSLRRGKDSHA